MTSIPWREEAHARALFSYFTNATTKCVDRGGGPVQQHDFDADLPDGTSVAVEVTRWNDPGVIESQAAIDKLIWRFPDLAHEWNLRVSPAARVQRLHQKIGPELSWLERTDGRSFRRAESHGDEGIERLCELGVISAYPFLNGAGDPGRINVLCEPAQFVYASSSQLVLIANRLATLPDNAAKLERAACHAERHLFVWLEWSEPGAVASTDAARHEAIPMTAPILPGFVDAVWLATAFQSSRVWRYSRSAHWECLGVFALPDTSTQVRVTPVESSQSNSGASNAR